jgi:hypothetical protein
LVNKRPHQNVIQIDPQVINVIIDGPVLPISANPFIEVVEPRSLDQLRELMLLLRYVLSLPHTSYLQKLFYIISDPQHAELVLKRAQFLYALCMRIPFCLYKYILNLILEMRDEHSIGLPFACLITKLIVQSQIEVSTEPLKRVQDPLGSQTLIKSNAQLRFEGQGVAHQAPPAQYD